MSDHRRKWEEVLPVIEAFVEGRSVQHLYDGRWVDTEYLTSVLHKKYRIRPVGLVCGTWSVAFTHKNPHGPGIEQSGTMTWIGNNFDLPPWPNESSYTYGPSMFTPIEE